VRLRNLNIIDPVAVGRLLSSQKPAGNPPATVSSPLQAAPPSPKVTVPELEPEEPAPDEEPELEPDEAAPDEEPELVPELVPDDVPELDPELVLVPELLPDVPPSLLLPSWLVLPLPLHARGAVVAKAANAVARAIEIR
jgi:hypothetical protein